MEFTKEQKQAIETLDRSVLVSAAAGSGKTAILVERILRIILEGRAEVDELLVVTFTRAAASEMKARLSRLIRRHMSDHPEDAATLRRQLAKMYRAYITSIDSFANRIDKEFFYEIDIEPNFSTCDEVQSELFMREAADELISELFETDDLIPGCSFREFMRLYSLERSEEAFKQELISLYSKLRTIPDYFEWARDKSELLKVTSEDMKGSDLQELMCLDAKEVFAAAMDAICRIRGILDDAGLDDLFKEKLSAEADEIAEIYSELKKGRLDRELMERMSGISYAQMRLKKEYKEAYEPLKAEVSDLRKSYKDEIKNWSLRYLGSDLETRLSEMNATYEYTLYYISLLEEFEKRYAEKKRARRVIDFADMEHYAVSILKKEEARDVLRRRFKYIFVDEYQDTNNIQEYLISKIARPGNVFRVGDVKQSIYRFRQAEPEIFERVYREYSDPDEPSGITIDLSSNFRTGSRTISYINKVFELLMEGYDERARLNAGLECPDAYDFVPEVHILTEESDAEDSEGTGSEVDEAGNAGSEASSDVANYPGSYAGADDDPALDLDKVEAETAYIAGLVRDIVGTEFYDTKAQAVRKAEPGDIAVLYRSVKVTGDILVRKLKEYDIQAHVEEAEKYFDTVEISVAMSMLMCIDNMKRDVPLIATLHSQAFGFSPEDLSLIRIKHTEFMAEIREAEKSEGGKEADGKVIRRRTAPFSEALRWYAERGPEGSLKEKTKDAIDAILGWRRLSRMLPLGDFVWTVLTESGYFTAAGAMNGGARRQANLRTLADKAALFSSETVSSLSSFVTFLDVLRKRNAGSFKAPSAGADQSTVRISTIHKSKGLEYPFVIVGGMGRRLSHHGSRRQISFDSSAGLGLPYIDPARRYYRSTLMQYAINAKSERDTYKEYLRVLYVAMTRARNRLILVGTCKSEEKLMKFAVHPESFFKMMRNVLKTQYNKYYISPLDRKDSRSFERTEKVTVDDGMALSPEGKAVLGEIDRRFSYKYPYDDLLTAKAKYSVSAIRRMELEEEKKEKKAAALMEEQFTDSLEDSAYISQIDNEVVKLWNITEQTKKRASKTDIGIAYHRIMEFLDFTKIDMEYIKERADYLAENHAIDEEAYRSVDLERVAGFFRSDPGKRAVAAASDGKLMKEKPFTLRTERSGREMLVQGVIDCCFEEDGQMVLIDYKSAFIHPLRPRSEELERIKHEYMTQLELYAEAVSKGTGLEVSEAYLYLFTTGEAVRVI